MDGSMTKLGAWKERGIFMTILCISVLKGVYLLSSLCRRNILNEGLALIQRTSPCAEERRELTPLSLHGGTFKGVQLFMGW